jgi:hypothetical protein
MLARYVGVVPPSPFKEPLLLRDEHEPDALAITNGTWTLARYVDVVPPSPFKEPLLLRDVQQAWPSRTFDEENTERGLISLGTETLGEALGSRAFSCLMPAHPRLPPYRIPCPTTSAYHRQ